MWRAIEILKYFQYSCSVSIDFLTNKFNVTSRTLQRSIVFINSSLIKISNCKISRKQNQFIINGDNKAKAINTLLTQFIHTASEDSFVRMSNLFLICIWQKKYITSETLIDITNTNKYNFKKDVISLNNFLLEQNLKINLEFKHNQGFRLAGCEEHLRFITVTIIMKLINNYNSLLLKNDKTLTYIYQNIRNIMINNGYKNHYNEQLIWFLTVAVRRIKFNFFIEKNDLFEFKLDTSIKQEIINFMLLISKKFNIKFDDFEINYFNFIVLLNTKINNKLFPKIIFSINEITHRIYYFIFSEYQISLSSRIFKKILSTFLIDNWFKLVFNYYSHISFHLDDTFEIESNYQWGQQILFIVNSQLKNNNFCNINLSKNKYLIMAFNSSFTVNENWKIPLYTFSIDDSYIIRNQINLFINANFPNILINSLKDNLDNIFKLHLFNQNSSILIKKDDAYNDYNLVKYKNISIINIYEKSWNYKLEENIKAKIKWVMLKKIQQSITVFNFYTQEKFYNIKSLIWAFQRMFIKKYDLNLEFLNIDECSIIKSHINEKILLIHQLMPLPNYNFPIILIYIKRPLIFHANFQVHFVFISLNNTNNTQNYFWINLWISLFKKIVSTDIKSINHMYNIIYSVIKN